MKAEADGDAEGRELLNISAILSSFLLIALDAKVLLFSKTHRLQR